MRFLRQVPPLIGTLDHSEIEFAASLVLFVLHKLRREWSASVSEVSWLDNPFLRPDWFGLIERGFCLGSLGPGGPVLTLTRAALRRVAAHIQPEAVS